MQVAIVTVGKLLHFSTYFGTHKPVGNPNIYTYIHTTFLPQGCVHKERRTLARRVDIFLICIVGAGVESNWVHSALRPPIGLLCQARMIMMMQKLVE
jgi:hypothetical protein